MEATITAAAVTPAGNGAVWRGVDGLQADLETLYDVTIPLGPLATVAQEVCMMIDSGLDYDAAAVRIRIDLAPYGLRPTVVRDVAATAYADVCRAG
ncbi:hypothetical protein UK82_28635 [Frankia sp. ACN1ag]|nr:hypothetical protein UK82_28635 [Frankia sp. ACN1ag]